MSESVLYDALGGYDGVVAFANDLFVRVQGDPDIGRFWAYRGEDGLAREKQLAIDYLCSCAGGQVYYTGRDMKLAHKGMGVTDNDYAVFMRHVGECMDSLGVPDDVRANVTGFLDGLKTDIVEA